MSWTQPSTLILASNLRRTAFALAMLCALAMIATPSAKAQTFTVIHSFSGGDGYRPYAGITLDAAGNVYGTTLLSVTGEGTAFKLKRSHGAWVLNPLLTFSGDAGANPASGLVFGPDGALYGTTEGGGSMANGLVYSLMPPATACKIALCFWRETVLYNFAGGSDGSSPGFGNVIFDHSGNIYGTTNAGGAAGLGTVYELTPSNGGWAEKVLYSFSGGNDGSQPYSGVILDQADNLYGTTVGGGGSGCGGSGCGTVYELSPVGSGWTENIIYSFQDGANGEYPYGGLIFDQSGNLYGSTFYGGSAGGGTVFEFSPIGGSWTFSLIYALTAGTYGGGGPAGSLAMDGAGNLYGTTDQNGAYGAGSVFKLTPQNGGWTYTTLHDFAGNGPDGEFPIGGPTVDTRDNLYGTASQAGLQELNCGFEQGCGVVWEITP